MEETKGIILFNRGDKCICRAIVCLYSLRKHYDGAITFYLEDPYPHEFDDVCKYFNVDVIHNEEKPELKALVRKTDMFANPPYDRTLWLDADMVIMGSLDEMFDKLDDADVVIPHFCGWWADGPKISQRTKRFQGIAEQRHIDKALGHYPATNTGILSFRKSDKWTKFVTDWVTLAHKGSLAHIFIPDEVSFQVLWPSIEEWGLKIFIANRKFNVSVLHDHGGTEDIRVAHFHGQKHCLDVPLCNIWKNVFAEMCKDNIANINHFLQYADKRLKKYITANGGTKIFAEGEVAINDVVGEVSDTTIVTACDSNYVEILKHTFPNWRKYKHIDNHPVIVFVNGMDIESDPRLEFLRLPNVTMIPWSKENDLDNVTDHREEMLSAFVLGAAKYVQTDYWLKLDADSYATDDRGFITDEMKQYAFCGHKWGYSRPDHIKQLDEWAKGHWKGKLKNAPPMINEGRIEGRRFYHNVKRTISFIQLHKSKFTRFCVKLLRERKLPAPTQDTYAFFVANRFDPHTVGTMNFKKGYGFTQGKGKLGSAWFEERMKQVDAENAK